MERDIGHLFAPELLQTLRAANVPEGSSSPTLGAVVSPKPANYPEIARFVTGLAFDSISANTSSL
jgi:hypothetical protein